MIIPSIIAFSTALRKGKAMEEVWIHIGATHENATNMQTKVQTIGNVLSILVINGMVNQFPRPKILLWT